MIMGSNAVWKKIGLVIIIISLAILYIGINNITIFETASQDAESVFNILVSKYNPDEADICILKYGQVTGAGWYVEKSTDKELEGEYVCMSAVCNPRALKENEDFLLDFTVHYVVSIEKTDKFIEIDGEKVKVISPKEIVITDYVQGIYKREFKDLSLSGKLHALMAFFVPKLRLSY